MFGFTESDIKFGERQFFICSGNKVRIGLLKFVIPRVEHSNSEFDFHIVGAHQRQFFELLGCGTALARLIEKYREIRPYLVDRFILLENSSVLLDRCIRISELRVADCETESSWNMGWVVLKYQFILCRGVRPSARVEVGRGRFVNIFR